MSFDNLCNSNLAQGVGALCKEECYPESRDASETSL